MQNMDKNKFMKWGAVIIFVLIVVLLISNNKSATVPGNNTGENNTTSTTTYGTTGTTGTKKTTAPTSLSGKCNLKITYPASGASVSFPLVVKGTIDTSDQYKGGCYWNEVTARAGTAQLFYNLNGYGWKSQGVAVPITTSGTTVASTSAFAVNLNFYNQGVGLPHGSLMKITFVEDNPLNFPNPDTFDFYVYLK